MNVFITGISGFIGFHTALRFAAEGHDVFGVDNFNDYYDVTLKETRTRILRKNGISVYNCDIRSKSFPYHIKNSDTDLVIHLAASAGVRYSMDHPQEYIDNNITGTQHVIKACEDYNVENVIYASTSCTMHGNPLPWREDEKLGPQLSPYGYSKATNEHQFNISKIPNTIGLRFFTVYGPWGRPDMALFSFTKDILDGKSIELYNYGDMKRDFTYIDDIVEGIFLVSQNITTRDIYNIGRGKQVRLFDFVSEIEDNLGIIADKRMAPLHPADAKETWSDTTKLQRLGYEPKTLIKEGVKNFIDWYKEYYKI